MLSHKVILNYPIKCLLTNCFSLRSIKQSYIGKFTFLYIRFWISCMIIYSLAPKLILMEFTFAGKKVNFCPCAKIVILNQNFLFYEVCQWVQKWQCLLLNLKKIKSWAWNDQNTTIFVQKTEIAWECLTKISQGTCPLVWISHEKPCWIRNTLSEISWD